MYMGVRGFVPRTMKVVQRSDARKKHEVLGFCGIGKQTSKSGRIVAEKFNPVLTEPSQIKSVKYTSYNWIISIPKVLGRETAGE